jgi:hypothetical protein
MNNDELLYKQKYLKYKFKYLELKNKYGGSALLVSLAKSVTSSGSDMIIQKGKEICIEKSNKALVTAKELYNKAKVQCKEDKECIKGITDTLKIAEDLHKKMTSETLSANKIGDIPIKSCKELADIAKQEATKALTKVK